MQHVAAAWLPQVQASRAQWDMCRLGTAGSTEVLAAGGLPGGDGHAQGSAGAGVASDQPSCSHGHVCRGRGGDWEGAARQFGHMPHDGVRSGGCQGRVGSGRGPVFVPGAEKQEKAVCMHTLVQT